MGAMKLANWQNALGKLRGRVELMGKRSGQLRGAHAARVFVAAASPQQSSISHSS